MVPRIVAAAREDEDMRAAGAALARVRAQVLEPDAGRRPATAGESADCVVAHSYYSPLLSRFNLGPG